MDSVPFPGDDVGCRSQRRMTVPFSRFPLAFNANITYTEINENPQLTPEVVIVPHATLELGPARERYFVDLCGPLPVQAGFSVTAILPRALTKP